MPNAMNPELHNALREAGASEQASQAAARSMADAFDMANKGLIWIKALTVTVGMLVAINAVALNQMFVLTAEVAENKANIATLMGDVEELKEGQREIINLLQQRLSKGADDDSAVVPEVSRVPQAPRSGNSHIDSAAPPEISIAPRSD